MNRMENGTFHLAKEALRDTMKAECYQKIYDYGNFSN